jgi:hypothetical protein
MKSTPKRLRLAKETVRMLSARHLARVAGGFTEVSCGGCFNTAAFTNCLQCQSYSCFDCEPTMRSASCDPAAMGC